MTGRSNPNRLAGTVAPDGDPVVEVQVIGPRRRLAVPCVIDTGFSGALVLPTLVAAQLSLPRRGLKPVRLADGSRLDVRTYDCEIEWLSSHQRVLVYTMAGGQGLVGFRLLSAHRLTIDYPNRTVELT